MAMLLVNNGKLKFLDAIMSGGQIFGVPYSNNYTPLLGSTLGDFTPATGLSDKQLTWGSVSIVNNKAVVESTATTFNGVWLGPFPMVIYGVYLAFYTDSLLLAERFATPVTIANSSGSFVRTFSIRLFGN